jgi:hypothetical protein
MLMKLNVRSTNISTEIKESVQFPRNSDKIIMFIFQEFKNGFYSTSSQNEITYLNLWQSWGLNLEPQP